MAKLSVNGAQLYYDIVGEGPPLVIAAGQGTGPQARQPLTDGLARQHTVLSYDPRGTGRSEPVPQGQSMEELAQDVLALMDAAKFEKARVLGISTGTGKATVLAALYPERVERLVLAAPWTHGDPALHILQNLRKAAARSLPPDLYVHFNALLLYDPAYRRAHAGRFAELASRALGQDAEGMAARLDAILRFDARPLYGRISCPTLICGARDDLVMPLWFAQDAASAIPGARLVVFEEGGHMFVDTRTDAFLQHVLPFLR